MFIGSSLVVQWFGISAVPVRGPGSLPGWGATVPQSVQCGQRKKYNNMFIAIKKKENKKIIPKKYLKYLFLKSPLVHATMQRHHC